MKPAVTDDTTEWNDAQRFSEYNQQAGPATPWPMEVAGLVLRERHGAGDGHGSAPC